MRTRDWPPHSSQIARPAPRPNPALLRRLSPSLHGAPEQIPLPFAGRDSPTPEALDDWPRWRHFRWQPFEQRPIPLTGALAYRLQTVHLCMTAMRDAESNARRVEAELAAEWAEHCRQRERYLLELAGCGPRRIGAGSPVLERTPLEEWIATGRVDLPPPESTPAKPRHALTWAASLPGSDGSRFLAVPPGVEDLTDPAPPVRLCGTLSAVLAGLPAGGRVMMVRPPSGSTVPPIKVLYPGPKACKPEWRAIFARMRAMIAADPAAAPLPWATSASFHKAIDWAGGGIPTDEAAGHLMTAAMELGYDVIHWNQGPAGRLDGALLTRRALRHALISEPLPPGKIPGRTGGSGGDHRVRS